MVGQTAVTFIRPTSERDDARATHNDTPEEVVTAYGWLRHRSMTRVQTDLGVGDENNWMWFGRLPNGTYPRSTWTAKATAQGRDRTFRIMGATQGMGEWQVALQET